MVEKINGVGVNRDKAFDPFGKCNWIPDFPLRVGGNAPESATKRFTDELEVISRRVAEKANPH